MKEDQVALVPIVWVHELRPDRRPLQPIDDFANLSQVANGRSIGVQSALFRRALGERSNDKGGDGRGVDLEVEAARASVLPEGWERLDFVLSPGRELVERELETLRLKSEAGRKGARFGHPAE